MSVGDAEPVTRPPTDLAPRDEGTPTADLRGLDDATVDARAPDALAADATALDARPPDARAPDALDPDARPPDALPPDARPPDAASLTDARPPDASLPDAPQDAVPPDATLDVSPQDALADAAEVADAGPTPDAFNVAPFTCSTCHGDEESPAPPRDLRGRLDTAAPGVGAHRAHLNAGSDYRPVPCEDCHLVPAQVMAPGHLDRRPADLTWGEVPTADGVVPSYAGGTCSVYCHGATLAGGTVPSPQWTTVDGSQAACGACHGLPPPAPHVQADDCSSCHTQVMNPDGSFRNGALHVDGIVEVEVFGCAGCHALPPDTGSHRTHAALAAAEYGGLGLAEDQPGGDGYAFGCGFCHPRDPARHRNGRVEVELFDPTAPADSLKGRNPATAAYTPGPVVLRGESGLPYTLGTCGDVACHAGTRTTSGPVPEPELDFPFVSYPIVYPPYAVERVPAYSVSPAWGSPSPGCGACHGYPPRTTYPQTDGGAGESHAYIGKSGNEDLHLYNHGSEPVACATCHHATVTIASPWVRDENDVITLGDIPIADSRRHVNGIVDVVFDSQTPQPYRRPLTLETATWDAEKRSCQDVACHLEQTEVTFGTPYRFESWVECNTCHRY